MGAGAFILSLHFWLCRLGRRIAKFGFLLVFPVKHCEPANSFFVRVKTSAALKSNVRGAVEVRCHKAFSL